MATFTGATGMSGAIGGAGNAGFQIQGLSPQAIGGLSIDTLRDSRMSINSQINIGLTKANGGFIIQIHTNEYNSINKPDYYIIPDSAEDFDRELGKIISLHLLKSNT